jgi:hypothetical protein
VIPKELTIGAVVWSVLKKGLLKTWLGASFATKIASARACWIPKGVKGGSGILCDSGLALFAD